MDRENGQIREFGNFRLDVDRKVLWFQNNPVDLPLKEIELLCVLTEKSGELLTKDELLERVWTGSFVEESNLSRHIYLIRQTFKELGEGAEWIRTVARRGYRFTGEVREIELSASSLVIEKHSVTRTLMEEMPGDDQRPNSVLASFPYGVLTPRGRVGLMVVSVIAMVGTLGGFAYYGSRKANAVTAHNIKTLAVLPFKTLGSTGENNQEGIGLADIVISRLSAIDSLTVRPTTAVMQFENSNQEPIDIGRKLLVDAVLEGSIYRSGDKTRVIARLITTSDQKLIWSSQFERVKAEEFRLQDEIALDLANALTLNLSDTERRTLTKRTTENADAYQMYLKGRYHWNKRNGDGLAQAERLFRNALEVDPTFALAYVGVADTRIFDAIPGEAVAALIKALELDPNSAEAHATMGFYLTVHRWSWKEAEASFKKSIELNPGYPTAHHWYAILLGVEGRFAEAKSELERALEINPLSYNFLADLGQVYYFEGDYAKAEEYCQKALALEPTFPFAYDYLSQIYLQTGQIDRAIEASVRGESQLWKPTSTSRQSFDQGIESRIAKLQQQGLQKYLETRIEDFRYDEGNFNYERAKVQARLGRNAEAIKSLERAFETRAFQMTWVKVDPVFESLRDDPRFQNIINKMGLA